MMNYDPQAPSLISDSARKKLDEKAYRIREARELLPNIQPAQIYGTNWKQLAKKSIVFMMNYCRENGLLFGPLGCIGMPEVTFLENREIVKILDEDFYQWQNKECPEKWLKLRKQIISNLFHAEVREIKGKKLKYYTNLWRATDRDIIMSAIYKKETVQLSVKNTWAEDWSKIQAVELTEDNLKLVKRVKQFEEQMSSFELVNG